MYAFLYMIEEIAIFRTIDISHRKLPHFFGQPPPHPLPQLPIQSMAFFSLMFYHSEVDGKP